MDVDWADPRDLAEKRVGSTLVGRSRWRILRLLAVGGSAWIYDAIDDNGRSAAVKVLHSRFATARQVVARFLREARVAALVDHPGVVRVFDEGACEGFFGEQVPFLAMELLRGETLEERRERKGGHLAYEEVLWETDQILAIVERAHAARVLHRDIKPENVFLTFDRAIRLLDFGVARLHRQESAVEDDEPPPSSVELTRVGVTLGTMDFMAPEQAVADWSRVGVQADFWAIGATMFTLLSGRFVHEDVAMEDLLDAARTRPAPDLREVVPDVPPSVAQMVNVALRFDANARWQTAREMRVALWLAFREARAAEREDEPPTSDAFGIPRPMLAFDAEPPPLTIEID